jgi:acetylornithine deacetylase/succinyl-diaminopimelate desuccinylase-like protein
MTEPLTDPLSDPLKDPLSSPSAAVPGVSVESFLRAHEAEILHDLSEWAAIPSVGGLPEHSVDIARSASWLAGKLREVGFTVELVQTGDSVAVVASLAGDAEGPSALVYSHHDVRDVSPEEWRVTHPFRPQRLDGRLYGRGTSDAKGQVIAHLWGIAALLAATGAERPPVSVTLLVEGEEELGSPNLRDLLEERREQFACDVIVFSDTVQWPAGNPSAVTTMRGTITASLTINGPLRDVHSGVVSGAAPNPVHALADVIAALHDDKGRVALPGFYDDVAPLSKQRRKELDDLPFDPDEWIDITETRALTGEAGHSGPERLWARPALEVLTLSAGHTSGPPRAVIPAQAKADISIRSVPDQRLDRVADELREFVAERVADEFTFTLEIDEDLAQEAYSTPHGPELDALERALTRGWGAPPRGRMGNAGGGPADVLTEIFGAPVIFLGTGLPNDRWHSSDESVDIETLLRGAASLAYLWEELAREQ